MLIDSEARSVTARSIDVRGRAMKRRRVIATHNQHIARPEQATGRQEWRTVRALVVSSKQICINSARETLGREPASTLSPPSTVTHRPRDVTCVKNRCALSWRPGKPFKEGNASAATLVKEQSLAPYTAFVGLVTRSSLDEARADQ